jgi:cell division inhibitor SepF
MAGFFKKAMDYLGLEPEDEYGDYDPYEDQPASMRRAPAAAPEPEPAPALVYPRSTGTPAVAVSTDSGVTAVVAQPRTSSPAVRTVQTSKVNKVHVSAPSSFGDAQDIGERFRSGQPVVIDLRDTDRDAAKRLIDFTSGLAFALNGEIRKSAEKVFLLRPNGVDLAQEEQRRLRDLGLMSPAS